MGTADGAWAFVLAMLGSSTIEFVATFFGLAAAGLTIRKHIWCFPVGLVEVTLFLVVFYRAHLYSDMLLRAIWFPMLCIGWYKWRFGSGGKGEGELPITLLGAKEYAAYVISLVCGTIALGWFMANHTKADLPYWDATTTTLQLLAQWLINCKKLEAWYLWIVADLLCIGIYYYKGLYPTLAMYVVFLGIATTGLLQWRRYRAAQKGL